MNRSIGTAASTALASLFLTGCFTTELDPDLGGVFACTVTEGEDDCPAGLSCVNERCEAIEDLPSLAIPNPEDEEPLSTPAVDFVDNGGETIDITMTVQGQLNLVDSSSGADHVFGEGHIVVFVDGVENQIIDSGGVSAPQAITVQVDSTPGPHRLSVQARRNDGIDYDNEGSLATRLFWLESDSSVSPRPFVAIKTPWPGTTYGLDATATEVTIATLNFDQVVPGDTAIEGSGHSHIYYEDEFPACVDDALCDGGYITVFPAFDDITVASEGLLPSSSEGTATLTAVLRNINHGLYAIPFGCERGVDDDCEPVLETITLNRVAQ
ncbi:MAG: hypothetical protein AAF799_11415 [Myxococcota bacterium]